MLKVLIADDEPVIRAGLTTILDWAAYGFEICGEAVNGRDALEQIARLDPDLIILDIKMPVIDGLELLERLRKQKSRIQAIILTGYPEFAYAQKAIKLGALNYILKPIDEVELANSVEEARQAILREATRTHATDRIILELCWGNYTPKLGSQALDSPGLLFPWQNYRVCVVVSEVSADPVYEYELIRKALNAYPEKAGYVVRDGKDAILLLRDSHAANPEGVLERISTFIEIGTGLLPFIAVGGEVDSMEKLEYSYREARDLLRQRFTMGAGIAIYGSGEKGKPVAPGGPEGSSTDGKDTLIDALCMAIDLNNKAGIQEFMACTIDEHQLQTGPAEKIKATFLHLYFAVTAKLKVEERLQEGQIPPYRLVLDEVYSCESLQELSEYISGRLWELSDELMGASGAGVIQQIVDYVQRNYHNRLTLRDLARHLNYSPAYLGTLFADQTGEQFNDYLSRVRLEKARELLQSGMKVSQAALMVGYKDVDYFSVKFKEYYGVNPSAHKTTE